MYDPLMGMKDFCLYVVNCLYVVKEGRKEMFYLTTYSTHFIYGYMVSHIGLW